VLSCCCVRAWSPAAYGDMVQQRFLKSTASYKLCVETSERRLRLTLQWCRNRWAPRGAAAREALAVCEWRHQWLTSQRVARRLSVGSLSHCFTPPTSSSVDWYSLHWARRMSGVVSVRSCPRPLLLLEGVCWRSGLRWDVKEACGRCYERPWFEMFVECWELGGAVQLLTISPTASTAIPAELFPVALLLQRTMVWYCCLICRSAGDFTSSTIYSDLM